MIILGIDPGTAITGFGVIKTEPIRHFSWRDGEKPKVIDFGCITTPKTALMGNRLEKIYTEVVGLIQKHHPTVISIESLYFFKNLKTALPVSQAKGVIMLAAAQKNIPIVEFTPLQVKMTISGYGRAEKNQIQKMTQQMLDISAFDIKKNDRKKDDAADALAVALCAALKKLP